MKIKIEIELEIPSVPNFILIKQSASPKQEGFRQPPTIHIKDLSREALCAIADEWKIELLKKAGHYSVEVSE